MLFFHSFVRDVYIATDNYANVVDFSASKKGRNFRTHTILQRSQVVYKNTRYGHSATVTLLADLFMLRNATLTFGTASSSLSRLMHTLRSVHDPFVGDSTFSLDTPFFFRPNAGPNLVQVVDEKYVFALTPNFQAETWSLFKYRWAGTVKALLKRGDPIRKKVFLSNPFENFTDFYVPSFALRKVYRTF